ncbi:MAG TPA: hydrogenase expression/formation C-terminal domain-containing protein [Gammaproteobacteria bacterium]
MNDDSSDTRPLAHTAAPSGGVNAQTLLHEIAALLRGLLERDEPAHIDLRALPLSRQDYAMLRQTVGEGEIRAEVYNLGMTHIQQTGASGVWWITHYNEEQDVIGEFLEIAFCPEALIADVTAVEEGMDALQARLVELEYLSGRGRKV